MGKRAILAILIWGICLTGCSSGILPEKTSPLLAHTGNYNTLAEIASPELAAVAEIRQSPASCTVTLQAPETVKDMTFQFHQDGVDVEYKNLTFQYDAASSPDTSAVCIAVDGLSKAMRDEVTMEETESAILLSGMLDAGAFTLELNPETGQPVKLSLPAQELEILFSDFTFLD